MLATAANRPSDGDQAIATHVEPTEAERPVHVTPSGEVITCVVPRLETAANSPSDGAQAMAVQLLSAALVLVLQFRVAITPIEAGTCETWRPLAALHVK